MFSYGCCRNTRRVWCERMRLSIHAAQTFNDCQRKFYHENIEGWELKDKPSWLGKGSVLDDLLGFADLHGYDKALEKALQEKDPYARLDNIVLLNQWQEMEEADPLPPLKVGDQEGVQVGFGFDTEPNLVVGDKSVYVTGYLDKLATSVKHPGQVIVVERKLVGEAIEDNSVYWKRWEMDSQTKAYTTAMARKGLKAGWVVAEVFRRLSTQVSTKLDKRLPYEEYEANVMAFLEKGDKKLANRKKWFISQAQLDEWENDHVLLGTDIEDKHTKTQSMEEDYKKYLWRRNPSSCSDYGGCPLKDVCLGNVASIEDTGKFQKSAWWIKNKDKMFNKGK